MEAQHTGCRADHRTSAGPDCTTVPGDCDTDGLADACETDTDHDGLIDDCDDDDDNDGVADIVDFDPFDSDLYFIQYGSIFTELTGPAIGNDDVYSISDATRRLRYKLSL